ncbi:MAG: TIGR03668 family PPOX class F420-dependent oxidoreductase [Acidimicrobiia bacterium]
MSADPNSNSIAWVDEVLATTPVARLGTTANDEVRLVPVCFAIVDGWMVSAIDHKPKRTGQLRRLDDMTATGSATLLLDHYDDDWTQLWWVRVRGRAMVHSPREPEAVSAVAALAAKYHQYREQPPVGAVFRVAMDELRWWRWSEPWSKPQ